MTILVAVVISQVVLQRLAKEQSTALASLSSAFMDGLMTAVTPGLLTRDAWETFDALDRAREQYEAVHAVFNVVLLPNGEVLAASDPNRFPIGSDLPVDLKAHVIDVDGLTVDEAQGRAWLTRSVVQEGFKIGTVFSEMDISGLLAVRREVLLTLLLVNGGVTLLFGAGGYILVRRMVTPLAVIREALGHAAEGRLEPIGAQAIDAASREHAGLYKQFNAMINAQSEREAMAIELAKQEQLAMLGRLASSMAHEVNNPLGGLMNAVDTLEAHGEDPAVRSRIIDLLRRGLRGIQQVVRATLVTYKSEHHTRQLTNADLQDLRFMIQHDTGAKNLHLDWLNELPETLALDASPVRQIVLNLLLNACQASPVGGAVTLRARVSSNTVRISVADQGPGLPPAALEAISAGSSADTAPDASRVAPGLGLWTAARLAGRLGGQLTGAAAPHGGALMELSIPVMSNQGGLRAVA
ncbi:MAG: HAMP domain-containing sensor histidine kinase [Dongiaceae bacterium]